MFHHSSKKKSEPTLKRKLSELTPSKSQSILVKKPKVQKHLADIEKIFAFESRQYDLYIGQLLQRFMNHVGFLPDSSTPYYAYEGGLFDYSLLRAYTAIDLFSGYLVLDEGQTRLSDIQACWQYALFSAALLKGVGKLYLDYEVNFYDEQGGYIKAWNPMRDPLLRQSPYHTLEGHTNHDVTYRQRLNLMLAKVIMPDAGMHWLSSYPDVFEAWLALLNEDFQSVKVLGAILAHADWLALQAAMAQWLEQQKGLKTRSFRTFGEGGDSAKNMAQLAGLQFLEWLEKQLQSGELAINDGLVNLDKSDLSLNVDLFKLFVKDFPTFKNWQAALQGFKSLGFHDASANTAELIFSQMGLVLPAKAMFSPPGGKGKTRVGAVELIAFAQRGGKMVAGQSVQAAMGLPHLNAKGGWKQVEQNAPLIKPGQTQRG